MIYLMTYEGLFRKKKEDLEKKQKGYTLKDLPSKEDPYWKYTIKWRYPDDTWGTIYLIMKFSHEDDLNGEGSGGEYVFNGIWMSEFNLDADPKYLKTKQSYAKVGEKSEQFEFSRGEWVFMDNVEKATPEEIKFYELHNEINKFNL